MKTIATEPPVHPGEVLSEDFLKPLGLSQTKLAKAIGVPPRRINEIVLEKRGVTADTALRLARYFSTSENVWMGLQKEYELDLARDKVAEALSKIIPFQKTVEEDPVVTAG